jgi:hypothetical protein
MKLYIYEDYDAEVRIKKLSLFKSKIFHFQRRLCYEVRTTKKTSRVVQVQLYIYIYIYCSIMRVFTELQHNLNEIMFRKFLSAHISALATIHLYNSFRNFENRNQQTLCTLYLVYKAYVV